VEEILVVFVQFLAEGLLNTLVYLPFELPMSRNEKTGERTGCGWHVVYLVLGGVVGAISVLVVPHLLLRSPSMRIANLLIAPLLGGGFSWSLTTIRRSWGSAVSPLTHFWTAFWFVLALNAVRLAYAEH
jgi:hypothetical protein